MTFLFSVKYSVVVTTGCYLVVFILSGHYNNSPEEAARFDFRGPRLPSQVSPVAVPTGVSSPTSRPPIVPVISRFILDTPCTNCTSHMIRPGIRTFMWPNFVSKGQTSTCFRNNLSKSVWWSVSPEPSKPSCLWCCCWFPVLPDHWMTT